MYVRLLGCLRTKRLKLCTKKPFWSIYRYVIALTLAGVTPRNISVSIAGLAKIRAQNSDAFQLRVLITIPRVWPFEDGVRLNQRRAKGGPRPACRPFDA